ncbi:hypothetical protein JXA34_03615 [Patescibacteria group bacterium]|nr:hypothetical protein [Patescibacteria group bacterium]
MYLATNPTEFLDTVYNGSGVPDLDLSLGGLVTLFVNLLIGVGLSISIITFAYAALEYAMSAGNPDRISRANKILLWAAVSAFVTLAAVGIQRAFFSAAGASSEVSDVVQDI